MEIKDMRKSKTAPFYTIECGGMFIDEDNDTMMRLDYDAHPYNAVNLKNGCVYTFREHHLVIPIKKATINIYE